MENAGKAALPVKKRKYRDFELDIVENAILDEIHQYFKENEDTDDDYRTAVKRFRKEIEINFDEFREKFVENIALKKSLKNLQDQQKDTRLQTLEAKKERTVVQQDLYELEMSQFVENQERLALEGLNDFFTDLDAILTEADTATSSDGISQRGQSTGMASANFDATLIESSRLVKGLVNLRSLADRLEEASLQLSSSNI
jgi:hypothetical protein